jgi:hypothetical protein
MGGHDVTSGNIFNWNQGWLQNPRTLRMGVGMSWELNAKLKRSGDIMFGSKCSADVAWVDVLSRHQKFVGRNFDFFWGDFLQFTFHHIRFNF